MVTAEIAVALPALILVTSAALWGVAVAATQLACIDAVWIGARAAARGEPLPAVRTRVAAALPPGATIEIDLEGDFARVKASVPIHTPLTTGLPPMVVQAHALAPVEPDPDP